MDNKRRHENATTSQTNLSAFRNIPIQASDLTISNLEFLIDPSYRG